MKKLFAPALSFCLLFTFFSCHKDEAVSPTLGKATFSLSPKTRGSGRVSETTTPAFVLLSIKGNNGSVQENVKLPLFQFGQSYLTESLLIVTGTYQLTQFAVLDAANKVIYATPLEGSDLAKYVTDPLPMSFTVSENQTTHIIPQVLAVATEDTPESFGLASFGFVVVKVAVIKASLTGAEAITKVSYWFTNGTQTISSEIVTTDSSLNLNIPELMGKTWQARILAWTEAEACFRKVYRYSAELTFDGSVLQLPPLTSESWVPFSYVEKNEIGIFRSDPRSSFQVEIQLPHEIKDVYGYVDRNFYNEAGDGLCDNKYSEVAHADVNGLIKVSIPDQTECDLTQLGLVDSFITLNDLGSSEQTQNMFYWEVKNGIVKPLCPSGTSSGGRIGTTRSHAPIFRKH